MPISARVDCLHTVAMAAEFAGVSAGDPTVLQLSLKAAEKLTDLDQKALALAVAAGCSPPSQAAELALRSFGLGGCWTTIARVCATYPEVVQVAADEYLGLLGRDLPGGDVTSGAPAVLP
jgi:hypothetical protein